ncbi:hypothetical protein [Streptomyces sp. NBC_01571]|uniref:hypothetical protein n=1 Tax=Streptomyces sp. NBC_01571 TaxID=2975883 RepID=UPI002B1CD4C4|nr:hypothetical protein [Streptomyces sp. NBC_01571]
MFQAFAAMLDEEDAAPRSAAVFIRAHWAVSATPPVGTGDQEETARKERVSP